MLRKLSFIVVLLSFIGAMTYSYFHFKTIKQPISNSIKAIPTSAALIVESKQIVASWQKLSKTNLIWQELLGTNYVNSLNSSLEFLDSLRLKDKQFNSFLKNQHVFVSAHMSGANNFNYLFTMGLPTNVNEQDVNDYIAKASLRSTKTTKLYDGISITSIKKSNSIHTFHYAVHEGILSCSYSVILVEDAIRQKQSQYSLTNINDFSKVLLTAGNKIDANLYINYKVFPNILSTVISPAFQSELDNLSNMANWAEVDLNLVPNAIKLNGYTYANDSVNNYLNAWQNQESAKPTILQMLPQNISTFIHLGYSDFDLFRKNYETYLEKNNKLFEFGAAIKLTETKYNINFTTDFLNHINNEMALVISESVAEKYKNGAFAVFKMKNIEDALSAISKIDTTIDNIKNIVVDSIRFKGYRIQQINLPGMMKILFGEPFSIVTENYYTSINNYLIFGNSVNSLRDFINYYERGKTLARDAHFSAFMDNLNNNSNIIVYSNIARSKEIYKAFVSNETANDIDTHKELLNKFEAVAIQISKSKNNLFYNNIYINHNPIEKKETSSLWDVKLDTSISRKPQLVTNHYSYEKEIFVQDDSNTIYLISESGEILWQRKIEGEIMGEAAQIDIFKNDKLQLLFNTKTKVHLIDRNGKNVTGYPVELNSEATAPLSVMDYDSNRNYRILLPTLDGNVLNFEASGSQVQGWGYESKGVPIIYSFKHLSISGKDYIISIDAEGQIHALNRKGEDRLSLVKTVALSPFYTKKSKYLSESFVLTQDTGGVTKVFFDDTKETLRLPDVNLDTRFFAIEMDNENNFEYVLIEDNEARVLNMDLKELVSFKPDSAISSSAYAYRFTNGEIELGFSCAAANEIFLLNRAGNLHEGFPLYGSTPFAVGDLNKDGEMELIVGSKDGHIYAYGLE